jgi:hypothetical protein
MKLVYMGKKRPKVFWAVPVKSYAMELDRAKRENAIPTGKEHAFDSPKNISVIACEVKERAEIIFEPFKAIDVIDVIADKLLKNCSDIIFKVGHAERKKEQKPDHKPDVDGYVGDTHADSIPDLEKQKRKDKKKEEGKSAEELIREGIKKKEKDE